MTEPAPKYAYGSELNPPKRVDRAAEAAKREFQGTKTQQVERPAQGNTTTDYTKLVKWTDA